MKTISLSLAVFFTLACVGVQAQEQAKVKVELIYKLDQAKQGNPLPDLIKALKSKAKDVPQEDISWVLNTVRFNIIKNKRILYANNGSIMQMPYFCYLPHSSNNKFIILNTCEYKKGMRKNDKAQLINIEEGKILWIKNKLLLSSFISNDGKVIIEQVPPSNDRVVFENLIFYDSSGTAIKNIGGLISFVMQGSISNDGYYFVLLSKDKEVCKCIGYNKYGQELWHKIVECGAIDINILSFFNNSKYFIYSVNDKSYLFDIKGNMIGEYNFKITHGNFTNDLKYFICGTNYNNLIYLNTTNGKALKANIANNDYGLINVKLSVDEENIGIAILDKEKKVQSIIGENILRSPNNKIIVTSSAIYYIMWS